MRNCQFAPPFFLLLRLHLSAANSNSSGEPSRYPIARLMKRKIIFHAGPTNSGKTYQSLQRLLKAKSGVYCAPLRLLAHEIYDKTNCSGTLCDLVTGQELIEVPGATHTACTIELTNIDRIVEVSSGPSGGHAFEMS